MLQLDVFVRGRVGLLMQNATRSALYSLSRLLFALLAAYWP